MFTPDLDVDEVKTGEEARSLAMDWQQWVSDHPLSLDDLLDYQDYFEKLAAKFYLTEEFKENGII